MWTLLLSVVAAVEGGIGLFKLNRYGWKPVWFEDHSDATKYGIIAEWITEQIREKGRVVLVKNNGGTYAWTEFHTYTEEEIENLPKAEWKKCKKQWKQLNECSTFLKGKCGL